jgi:hypothetical protein
MGEARSGTDLGHEGSLFMPSPLICLGRINGVGMILTLFLVQRTNLFSHNGHFAGRRSKLAIAEFHQKNVPVGRRLYHGYNFPSMFTLTASFQYFV